MRGAVRARASAVRVGKFASPVYGRTMLRQFALALLIGIASSVVSMSVSMAGPRSGIGLSAIDPAVRPQDDFWQYANGKWLAATEIPADRSSWDTFSQVREATQTQLR